MQRQLDGCLPVFPIWDDIRTFDGKPWRGCVDVVSGGFPCQDISSVGSRRGLAGDRSGLWFEMLRVIGEVRPAYVFAENSPDLRTRGLDVVLEGLESLGYLIAWLPLSAWHLGAPHRRKRLWLGAMLADPDGVNGRAWLERRQNALTAASISANTRDCDGGGAGPWALPLGPHHRVVDGMGDRLDRCRAAGNGQVPIVAATAWEILSDVLRHAHNGGNQ